MTWEKLIPKPPEIEKYLVLSTAHISKKDGELLAKEDNEHIIVDNYDFGWRVMIFDLDIHYIIANFSPGFIAAIMFAITNDCQWIKLDEDGPIYETLQIHEW